MLSQRRARAVSQPAAFGQHLTGPCDGLLSLGILTVFFPVCTPKFPFARAGWWQVVDVADNRPWLGPRRERQLGPCRLCVDVGCQQADGKSDGETGRQRTVLEKGRHGSCVVLGKQERIKIKSRCKKGSVTEMVCPLTWAKVPFLMQRTYVYPMNPLLLLGVVLPCALSTCRSLQDKRWSNIARIRPETPSACPHGIVQYCPGVQHSDTKPKGVEVCLALARLVHLTVLPVDAGETTNRVTKPEAICVNNTTLCEDDLFAICCLLAMGCSLCMRACAERQRLCDTRVRRGGGGRRIKKRKRK